MLSIVDIQVTPSDAANVATVATLPANEDAGTLPAVTLTTGRFISPDCYF